MVYRNTPRMIIDRKKLREMRRRGATVKHCADAFGVSVQSIYRAEKNLNDSVGRNLALSAQTGRILNTEENALLQFNRCTADTLAVIDLITGFINGDPVAKKKFEDSHQLPRTHYKDPYELLNSFLKELRKQVELQGKFYESYTNMRNIENFQHSIIETITECEPALREKIVAKLNERRFVERTVRFSDSDRGKKVF